MIQRDVGFTHSLKKIAGRAAISASLALTAAVSAGTWIPFMDKSLYDLTAQSPEDALRDLGYDPGKLTEKLKTPETFILDHRHPLYDLKILSIAVHQLWNSKTRSPAMRLEELAKTPWDFKKHFQEIIEDLQTDRNLYARVSGAVLTERAKKYIIVPTTGEDSFNISEDVCWTKKFNVFVGVDPSVLKAFVLLHEWRHAAQPKPDLSEGRGFVNSHKNEIDADLYAVSQTKALTGVDIRQAIADFRILGTFRNFCLKDFFDGDKAHNSALSLNTMGGENPADQRRIAHATDAVDFYIFKALFKTQKNKLISSPEKFLSLVRSMQKNGDLYQSSPHLSGQQKEDISATLQSLSGALERLIERGPIEWGPAERLVLQEIEERLNFQENLERSRKTLASVSSGVMGLAVGYAGFHAEEIWRAQNSREFIRARTSARSNLESILSEMITDDKWREGLSPEEKYYARRLAKSMRAEFKKDRNGPEPAPGP